MSAQTFLSPSSKLLPFFHKSRNQWKAKCKQAQQDVKSLKIRLAKMKASRDRWKEQALPSAATGTAPAEPNGSTTKKSPAARSACPSRRRRSLSAAGATGGR